MKKELDLSTYKFALPAELIAQKPAKPADACRLLVLDRQTKKIKDEKFLNLPKYLHGSKGKAQHHPTGLVRGDVLVFNNSKVIPARLIGQKPTGGKVEILLLKQITANTWECLIGNLAIKKQINTTLSFGKNLSGTIISRQENTARINFNLEGSKLMKQILKLGQMPTPPYIKRIAKANEYQTFFADSKKLGSVAAPTAGLHFTPRIFKMLKQKGVQIEFVTLHVGLGTFQPIKPENITKHQIHSEYFEMDKPIANRLNKAKKENRRIIAVGTTSVRVLETCASVSLKLSKADKNNNVLLREPQHDIIVKPQKGNTSIYIYPNYKFKFIDAIITNFHLPQSSLIILVSAFAGTDFIKKAYRHAIRKKYRFYSFGDVMLII